MWAKNIWRMVILAVLAVVSTSAHASLVSPQPAQTASSTRLAPPQQPQPHDVRPHPRGQYLAQSICSAVMPTLMGSPVVVSYSVRES